MPKVLLDDRYGKFRNLTVLINGSATADKKDAETIGAKMGMSRNTVIKYLKSPEKLPVGELLKLGRVLNIPIDDLRECLFGCLRY